MPRTSSRQRSSGPVFPTLPPGIQAGLKRLVSDNVTTVACMLDVTDDTRNAEKKTNNDDDNSQNNQFVQKLCEECAKVMKQQQLSPSSFLARFFDATILSQHASEVLNKSGKGSAPTLAERIAGEWAKSHPLQQRKPTSTGSVSNESTQQKPSEINKETPDISDRHNEDNVIQTAKRKGDKVSKKRKEGGFKKLKST